MAMTLAAWQRLEDAGLLEFFEANSVTWAKAAKRTYRFVKRSFPSGAAVRHDDVAKALLPVVEVNEALRAYLNENKLRGKFWKQFFADLITDRTWDKIQGDDDE